MLFALAQPVVFVGLLVAFLLALVVRAYAIRISARALGLLPRGESVTPRPREDIDPFGAVAAAVGGVGWGKAIDIDEVPRFRGRGRAAWVFAAGPLATLILSQLLLLVFRLVYPFALGPISPSSVLTGAISGEYGAQFLLAVAVGLLAFGLLALIPVPPLDGFGLLWLAVRRPGRGMLGYRLWFEDKNLGVVVLLACCFFPLGAPFLLIPIDLVGGLVLRAWSS